MDTFDPKPDAPREIRGPFTAIQTNLPGIRISEHPVRPHDRLQRFQNSVVDPGQRRVLR